jgi:hypothetical protein
MVLVEERHLGKRERSQLARRQKADEPARLTPGRDPAQTPLPSD